MQVKATGVLLRLATDEEAGMEHHGHVIPVDRDATMELLELVEHARGDLVEIFADMRIARFDVSRWAFRAAPSTIVVDAALDARLAPRRRG